VALVIHGGFVYFNSRKQVIGATAIVAQGEGNALIQFNEGKYIDGITSKNAVDMFETRFAEVTLPFMTAKGAVRYAWILPGEQISPEFENKMGGFLYQFNEDAEYECRFFPILSGIDE
jgi:hypothetical protein